MYQTFKNFGAVQPGIKGAFNYILFPFCTSSITVISVYSNLDIVLLARSPLIFYYLIY